MKKIDIIIADDHHLFRSGLTTILEGLNLFNSIHQAENGQQVLDLMKNCSPVPELVLLDVKMPVLNGFDTLKILKQNYPGIKVIMLTMVDQEQFINHTIKEDVNAYLLKNVTETDLRKTLESVIRDGYYLDHRMIQIMHKSHTNKQQKKDIGVQVKISDREREVLTMLCKEHSATEIADSLFISRRTVEVHKQNLMAKTNTKNTVGLVLYAIRNGIVVLP